VIINGNLRATSSECSNVVKQEKLAGNTNLLIERDTVAVIYKKVKQPFYTCVV